MSLAEANRFAADPTSDTAPGAENDKGQAGKKPATPLARFVASVARKVFGLRTGQARLRSESTDTAPGEMPSAAESADPADGWYAVGRGL